MINPSIFRSYDVRGIYPADVNEQAAWAIGAAFGKQMGKGKKLAVGNDVRTSSPGLVAALIKGIASTGARVTYIGQIPTPVLFFSVMRYKLDGGVTVTASHNPKEWNGFKFCGKAGASVFMGTGLEKIRDASMKETGRAPDEDGKYESKAVIGDYEDFMAGAAKMGRKLSIGIDPGNGAYSAIATRVLKRLGISVTAINDSADGEFPNRAPEPKPDTITELCRLVKERKLDFGAAFDADGDRVIFVDDTGRALSSDEMLCFLISAGLGSGEKVVYDISCSNAVQEVAKQKGGITIPSRIGSPYIRSSMRKNRAVLGGELSGHLYFRETGEIDDGLFGVVKTAELLSRSGMKFSELLAELPHYERSNEEMRLDDSRKERVIEALRKRFKAMGQTLDIDGVKLITPDGWVLIRASNTGPMVRLTAEGKDRRSLDSLVKAAKKEFAAAVASL